MDRKELAPGAYVSVFPAEKFKRCRITINFIWPARREAATAQALLPLLMERGCAACPDMTELSKRLAALYGAALSVDCTLTGANRVLTVSISGIRDAYALEGENLTEAYASLAFDTAFRPYFVNGVFDPEAVAIERDQLRELLEGEINEKRSYCIRQARRKFFGDASQGIERSGYLDEVDTLTPQAVTDAFAEMVRTAQIEVMVLGAQEAAVSQQLLAALAGVQRAPAAMLPAAAMPRQPEAAFRQPMDTVQGKLCLLFTAGKPVSLAQLSMLRVAVALLGGTATSRLFTNVREKRSLCYYCAASFQSVTASMSIDSGVEHSNADAARAAILQELEALRTGEITEKELAETKRTLLSSLAAVEDSLMGIESWYFAELMRGTDKTPAAVMEEVSAVTAQDVRDVLSRFSLSVSYLLTKEEAAHA